MPSEYKYNTSPVPTVYKDRQYRSRLEAKWAAFFDLVGWQCEYEPCDLNGWFPDFALYGKSHDGKPATILCEVKPIVEFDKRTAERMQKALAGTYYQNSELLLLGSGPVGDGSLGWLYEQPHGPWGAAVLRAYGVRSGTTLTYAYGFAHESGSSADRITGHHQKGRPIAPEDCGLESLSTLWQQAGNITQYKPPKTPRPAPEPVEPPPATSSDEKPQVNSDKKKRTWIMSCVLIATVIICGLLLSPKQPPTPKSSDQNADRIAALERENARLKREKEQFSAMPQSKQPSPPSSTPPETEQRQIPVKPPPSSGVPPETPQSEQPSPPSSTPPETEQRQIPVKQSPSSSAPPETPPSRAKPDPGTPQQSLPPAETWRGLTVAPEQRCAPYNRRDYYSYSQSLEPRIVKTLGSIYSPYTGQVFTDLKQTHINRIVATSEAHDSGLCAATAATRRDFAADLLNLTLASPEVSRCEPGGKCAYDAAEWLPRLNQCWFADRVVAVRRKYHLTIDRREADALERVLAACHSTAMIGPEDAAALDESD